MFDRNRHLLRSASPPFPNWKPQTTKKTCEPRHVVVPQSLNGEFQRQCAFTSKPSKTERKPFPYLPRTWVTSRWSVVTEARGDLKRSARGFRSKTNPTCETPTNCRRCLHDVVAALKKGAANPKIHENTFPNMRANPSNSRRKQ